ncbi:hypothetical protein Tco_0762211 [Tanacetum coccineum]
MLGGSLVKQEPSGQNVPFNANGQNVSFNANGQNVSPNHAEFNVSFNANGQNVSYNHAEFNVFPNSANGLNLDVNIPSLVRTSDNDGRTSPSNLNSHANVAHFWESIHHVEKEISTFADANSDYDDEAPFDDGANPNVEALLRDFFQRMDSLAGQGASLSDVSTHGVDAMSNSYTGYESIPNGTDHVTHVETNMDAEFLIQNINEVAKFFGVPLSSLKEIDDFTRELEAGNNQLWLGQTMDIRN